MSGICGIVLPSQDARPHVEAMARALGVEVTDEAGLMRLLEGGA